MEDAVEQRRAGCLAPTHSLHLFPGVPFEFVEILKTRGIEHTGHFLELTETGQQCSLLARHTGIPENRIVELRSLCDLSRIRGIEPPLARVMLVAKVSSVKQMASERPASLYQRIAGSPGPYPEVTSALQKREIREFINCARIIVLTDERSRD
jgi:hypothetical protein